MRSTQRLGRISRSKKRPHPTLRSGRGSRTNSNTSRQIPARVIEADSVRAISRPLASTRPARLDQFRAGARNEIPRRVGATEIAKALGIGRASVYRVLEAG